MIRRRRLGSAPAPTPAAVLAVDFTAQSIQDPLSIGGTWSNNTQGVGGNVAPTNLASMQIATGSGAGAPKIACHATALITDSYNDSFAFIPNVSSGNLRITATIYRAAGYTAPDTHELELILGCKTTSGGNHRWLECLWNSVGGADIVDLDGGPSAFLSIGSPTGLIGPIADGDTWVAELDRIAGTVKWWVNGVLGCQSSHANIANNPGTGCGIAAFCRTGGTYNAMGFRTFLAETF